MIKVAASRPDGSRAIVLVIDDVNIGHLKADRALTFELRDLLKDLPYECEVIIAYEQDLKALGERLTSGSIFDLKVLRE